MRCTKQIRLLFIVFLASSLVMACATMTPLTKAAKDGDINKINALISSGGDINERDPETRRTPLYNAVLYNQRDAVKLLIENGANINIADEWGYTPLIVALQNCHSDIAKTLIERGANINTAGGEGWTPLALAAFCNNKEIVNFLLEKGADIEISDKYGSTPLIQAAFYGHTEIAKLLIEKGANINAPDNHGSTALIIAIKNRNTETARLLIEEGANVHAVDSYGRKASDYAKISESPKEGIHKAFDFAERSWKTTVKKFKTKEGDERKESLLKLLEDKEAKQVPIAVHVTNEPECTQTPLPEVLHVERGRAMKIAVLPERLPPETDAINFVRTYGVAKGALYGAAMGAYAGVALTAGTPAAIIIAPITATVGLVVGTVASVVSTVPAEQYKKKALEMKNETNKILLELKIQETMAKHVQKAGKRETDRDFVIFNEIGPSSPADKPDYTRIMNQGVEAVLEIAVKKIGTEKFIEHRDLYYFYIVAQARLVRGNKSSKQTFKYIIGPPRTYSVWGSVGAETLQKEIDQAYVALAEDIVEYIFLYAYFDAEDSPLSRLYDTSHISESKDRDAVLKIYKTRYIMGSLYGIVLWYPDPPDTVSFLLPNASSTNKVINTLQPTFRWEAFPASWDIREDRKGIVDRISDVTYDLRLWRVNEKSGKELIYEKKGLKDNKHKIECSLKPASNYLWTVRARFKLDDKYKSTYWATFPKLHGEDATPYQMRGHGIDLYTGSIPVIRSYYPFTTRAEYKKINQDSGHK